jgi:hypothetical protein
MITIDSNQYIPLETSFLGKLSKMLRSGYLYPISIPQFRQTRDVLTHVIRMLKITDSYNGLANLKGERIHSRKKIQK